MSKPQVIIIAANAGVGSQPAQQIPTGTSGAITLINLSNNLGLILSDSSDFSTSWPLNAATVLPQTGISTLFVMNTNNTPIQVEVLQGIVPVSSVYKPNLGGMLFSVNGYAGNTINTVLPVPPVGFAYNIVNISYATTALCGPLSSQLILCAGGTGQPFLQAASTMEHLGFTFADTKNFVGLVINNSIIAQLIPALGNGFQVNLVYNLISIV